MSARRRRRAAADEEEEEEEEKKKEAEEEDGSDRVRSGGAVGLGRPRAGGRREAAGGGVPAPVTAGKGGRPRRAVGGGPPGAARCRSCRAVRSGKVKVGRQPSSCTLAGRARSHRARVRAVACCVQGPVLHGSV